MNSYREQVTDAIRALEIISPTSFSWFGVRSPSLLPGVKKQMHVDAKRRFLREQLRATLYSDFYCQGQATAASEETHSRPRRSTDFLDRLSSENSGTGYWQHGWQVQQLAPDGVHVSRNALGIAVGWEDCRAPSAHVSVGMDVELRRSKEARNLSPGFYIALSDLDGHAENDHDIVRIYWNLVPDGALALMGSATRVFRDARFWFRLKVLNHPFLYTRCDAGVLYLRASDYHAAAPVLQDLYVAVASKLNAATPVFCKRLAPGIALAEDPGDGGSFGLHRSAMMAEGLIRASERLEKSVKDKLRNVEECFADDQVDLDTPYLRSGREDRYDLLPLRGVRVGFHSQRANHAAPTSELVIQTASEIGDYLARSAVWYEGRCTWLGVEPQAHGLLASQAGVTQRALGADLYSGTSGVAWFLAELYRVTKDTSIRRTALGAVRHALSRSDRFSPSSHVGLFTGRMGVAVAAARLSRLLTDEQLLDMAIGLAKQSTNVLDEKIEFDFLSGIAGAIVGLLRLYCMTKDEALLDCAVGHGDRLLAMSEQSPAGCSWRSLFSSRGSRNLTGLSHGAAGAALALTELYSVTHCPRFRVGAELGFKYEGHWFDSSLDNWPDFRKASRRGGAGARQFAYYWCHGAPGIALTRLRAYAILKEERYKAEAEAGLRATGDAIKFLLSSGAKSFCICHGLAGNADVLLQAYSLGVRTESAQSLAEEVALHCIERSSAAGSSVSTGEFPGLMLGLAGLGYFYLRVADRGVPSFLTIQPELFSP